MRRLGRAGAILVAWAALIYAEQLYVLLGSRGLFAGSWEISAVRQVVTPLAIVLTAPLALAVALLAEAVVVRPLAATAFGALAGAGLGWAASYGRHFASLPLRASFVLVLGAAFALLLRVSAPRLAALSAARPYFVAAIGTLVAVSAWWIDGHLFLHLYNGVHAALELGALVSAASLSLVVKRGPRLERGGALVLVICTLLLALVPKWSRSLRNADNVRFVLAEHAPILGRAVEAASYVAPPPPLDDSADPANPNAVDPSAAPPPGDIARALDWTGHDVLLLSIDAVRADHVGAYGYARKTTPGIDALAAEGTLFLSAYCPTPHTSYSITSMMTGKYMRPLLALGLGEDSETWAGTLRRYDYRTAAFYPPAVFFVDQPRFGAFESSGFDFEYRRVEFRDAASRVGEVASYLKSADSTHPLFLWVHLFEPHEPYILHPEHPFGDPAAPTDVDRYDSEIATADAAAAGIVKVLREARAARGAPVIVITADHGEEFGDHGGRYHGGDVFTEQVRVPLVVVGPGVRAQNIAASVQTIDLYPTTISALGVPRPARIRGGDLGPLLAGKSDDKPRVAFSENDDYARVTRGDDVLVCRRSVRACALYNRANDPGERTDVASQTPTVAQELRHALTAIERENGRFERGAGADWPEPIRRGLQGDASAAIDVAALLDDAKLTVRAKAAEVLWRLHDPETLPAMRRAADHDLDKDDEEVRRWSVLGLVRTTATEVIPPRAEALLHDSDVAWRRRAALSFAERNDARGEAELVAWWSAEAPPHGNLPFDDARALLLAMQAAHTKTAATAIAASLGDVRLRPEIARTLATLGVPSALPTLVVAFSVERYVSARDVEAEALVTLGAHDEIRAPLARFAGLPEPMTAAIDVAARIKALTPAHGGFIAPTIDATPSPTDVTLTIDRSTSGTWDPMPLRLVVATPKGAPPALLSVNGTPHTATVTTDSVQLVELSLDEIPLTAKAVRVTTSAPIAALWLVSRSVELPPPPPVAWSPKDAPK